MAKIKYSDIKQRNKILMNVVWSHLKGNKKPYLSVDIKQVIHYGKRIHDWDSKKKAIKTIHNDLGFLVDSHLCSPDGYDMHMASNTIYFFEKTKEHTLQPPTTNESDIWTIDWTIERFAEYTGMHTDQVKELFFDPDYKDTLASISKIKAEKAQKRLDRLTKQYNIETVHG